jgi:hypothetical protein
MYSYAGRTKEILFSPIAVAFQLKNNGTNEMAERFHRWPPELGVEP